MARLYSTGTKRPHNDTISHPNPATICAVSTFTRTTWPIWRTFADRVEYMDGVNLRFRG